jgi:hypothetical protein
MNRGMEANAHTCRDNIRKKNAIHRFITCSPLLIAERKTDDGHRFFLFEVEREKIAQEEVFMPSVFYASLIACALVGVL